MPLNIPYPQICMAQESWMYEVNTTESDLESFIFETRIFIWIFVGLSSPFSPHNDKILQSN